MDTNTTEFLTARINALYVHDARNRLLRVNETDSEQPIPYFYFLRGKTANLWRVRHDIPDDLAHELDNLARTEPLTANLDQPLLHKTTYQALLGEYLSSTESYSGPAYHLPEREPSSTAILITSANQEVLSQHFSYAISEYNDLNPIAVQVIDGRAVAICFCSRKTEQVAEAGIYTEENFRGQGYAVEVARTWAHAVRSSGRIPLYSTSHDNQASQSVANKLGAIRYGTDFHFA